MNKKLIFCMIYLIIAIVLNCISSSYISNKESVKAPDLFVDSIDNEYPWAMKLAEILIICSVIYAIPSLVNTGKLTYLFFLFGSFFLIRAILMPLTILEPLSNDSYLCFFKSFQYGLFPSGHTSIPFILMLISKNKWFYAIITLIVGILLILSKNHYTIDVIATIFIAYSIKCFSDKWLASYLQ